MRHRQILVIVLAGFIAACSVLDPATPTPIYVTATPRIVIVTSEPTQGPTPVIAPSLEPNATVPASTFVPATYTATVAITLTPTFTPTPTDTPVTPGVNVFVPVGGVGGSGFTVSSSVCTSQPSGGFGGIFSDPTIAGQLGCPIDPAVGIITAYQPFERGLMVWVSQVGTSGQAGVFVFYSNSTYQRFIDTWREGIDPASTGLTPPSGRYEPVRGFGKVWRESAGVRDALGWATSLESGANGNIQVFERGEMVFVSQTGQTYVAIAGTPGTWTAVSVSY